MAKIFQSKAYQTIMNYIYGWGAAAVIIGALFKIMHFPGAGLVLTIGMVVEAAIFILSAFEPPLEHYDWSRVYPELSHKGLPKEKNAAVQVKKGSEQPYQQPVDTGVIGNVLDDSDIMNLKEGISKIVKSADNFAEATLNVPEFTKKITDVTNSFGQLEEKTQEAGKALESSIKEFSEGCTEINKVLLNSGKELTEQVKQNCEKLTESMGYSSETFNSFNKIMDEQMGGIKAQSENYSQQITSVNKNVSALNAIYELQINETKEYLDSFKNIQKDMNEMLENVSLGLDNTKLFKQETQQLANNVASLNSVYGNMLSIVNNN